MRTSLSIAAVVVAMSVAHQSNAQFQLIPGQIVGEDSVAPGGTTFQLISWNQTGVVQQTLAINSTGTNFGTMDGLAIVGNQVWVVGTSGLAGQVNLTTGVLSGLFTVGSGQPEALGTLGSDLIVGYNSGNVVRRYTTAGVLVSEINLGGSRNYTAIDADGTRIFAGSNTSGQVDILDLSGNLLSSFNTIANNISGLGYDPATDSLWIANGFGNDRIVHYTLTGTMLSSFASGFSFVDGLDVVPVPAPGAGAMFGLLGAACLRRRRR